MIYLWFDTVGCFVQPRPYTNAKTAHVRFRIATNCSLAMDTTCKSHLAPHLGCSCMMYPSRCVFRFCPLDSKIVGDQNHPIGASKAWKATLREEDIWMLSFVTPG